MNNTTQIQDLAKTINTDFIFFYEMKEGKKYETGCRQLAEIKESLSQLNPSQLSELKELITVDMEMVNRYFSEYFENAKPASKLSTIMSTAWAYFKKGIFTTFADCLKASWKAFKTIKALKNGIVSFTYRKATGQIRQATGTLNKSLFTFTGKGVRKPGSPDAIKYYDTEKDAWRMFRIERLLSVAA